MCTDYLHMDIYLRQEIYATYIHPVKIQQDQRGETSAGRAGGVRGEGRKQHKIQQTPRGCRETEALKNFVLL